MTTNEQEHSSIHNGARPPTVCDVPQLSRMACSFCRIRKLKCNKVIPTCGSCSKYRHQCIYESTRKVGPSKSRKKGYVSALQERLGRNSLSHVTEARYLAATELELGLQPPIYLRHAVLALAACASPKHAEFQERFYRSSREALEFVEMSDDILDMVSVEQAQTWVLIATYEFRRMHFHRSWMSTGRAVRLVQMMGLHCMDSNESDISPLLVGRPNDWTAREERRRTFWMAFCLDRYAAIGHGWPSTVDDKDIHTRLPAPEEAFQSCTETLSPFLREAMTLEGAATLSPFAGLVAMTGICSQRLTNIRRFGLANTDHREFWRTGTLDSNLVRPLIIPSHLRVPAPKWDPNLYFLNMVGHASTIGVHQMALAMAGADSLHRDAMRDSERVRVESAIEIASIMRSSCHVDLSAINPFTSFCLYVAAAALKRTKIIELDEHQKNSLQFLLTAMNYLEEVNPMTTAFKRDLETEFPDLTASLSGLDVASEIDKDGSSPESIEHSQRNEPRQPCMTMKSSGARSSVEKVNPGFSSQDGILSQEWLELPETDIDFGDNQGVDFHAMDPFLATPGDESLGDLFRRPGGPGMH
ncbi:Citrinin biosynthesis transcriptional activator ctnR [Hyphodiscus hymeniophilus]|uniref:Citrinin biosynthesis transcriptional activator ctnR n=1 Tax=Hyphodiscus hymeniophilus TaxID=353542 RepID=A0A9P6VE49_9HELO|nr:Citrinin biosynthesis transcriptional activator ctnR [Hyphodiscus hymeniophilus]